MSSTRTVFVSLAWLGVALCLTARSATAAVIFLEDFSSISGPPLGSAAPSSERGGGDYLGPITLPGWTIDEDDGQVFGFDRAGDLALLLNEGFGNLPGFNATVSRTITGLLPGVEHTLSFEYWGDNETAPYSFFFEINGVTTPITATHSGQNTGRFTTETFTFTPVSSTTILRFGETSTTFASPVFDNIAITAATAVPEPTSLTLLGVGAAVGLIACGRRRRLISR